MICIIDFGFVADCVFSQIRQNYLTNSIESQPGHKHTRTHIHYHTQLEFTRNLGLAFSFASFIHTKCSEKKGFEMCNEWLRLGARTSTIFCPLLIHTTGFDYSLWNAIIKLIQWAGECSKILIEIGILYSRQPLQPNIIKFITNAKLVPINCRFVTVTCIPNDREKSTFKYYLADLEEWRRKMHKHTHFFSRFVDIICRSLSLVLLIWQDIWLLLSTIKFPFFRRLILHQVQRFHCWTFPF